MNKEFDSTICFTFFGSWIAAIERLETDTDADSPAYTLFKAIAYYSMYGDEPDFGNNQWMWAIWATIEREVDRSVNRRKSGFAQDERYRTVRAYKEEHPTATVRQISDDTGISRSAVGRIVQRIDDIGVGYSSDTDSVTDSVNDNDNVTVGRDSGTNPQSLSNTREEDYSDRDTPIVFEDGHTPTSDEIAEAYFWLEQQDIERIQAEDDIF